MAERDFLYQRRLVGFRTFVNDQGMPGIHLKIAPDDQLTLFFTPQLLEALRKSLDQVLPPPTEEEGSSAQT